MRSASESVLSATRVKLARRRRSARAVPRERAPNERRGARRTKRRKQAKGLDGKMSDNADPGTRPSESSPGNASAAAGSRGRSPASASARIARSRWLPPTPTIPRWRVSPRPKRGSRRSRAWRAEWRCRPRATANGRRAFGRCRTKRAAPCANCAPRMSVSAAKPGAPAQALAARRSPGRRRTWRRCNGCGRCAWRNRARRRPRRSTAPGRGRGRGRRRRRSTA